MRTRRLLIVCGLAAWMAGGFAAQAEAADALADSVAEIAHPDVLDLPEPDLDAPASLLEGSTTAAFLACEAAAPALDSWLPDSGLPASGLSSRRSSPSLRAAPAGPRCAWLQVFRF